MERHEILDMMATLKLAGMRAAFDEIIATGMTRRHPVQQIVADLLKAEMADAPLRHHRDRQRELAVQEPLLTNQFGTARLAPVGPRIPPRRSVGLRWGTPRRAGPPVDHRHKSPGGKFGRRLTVSGSIFAQTPSLMTNRSRSTTPTAPPMRSLTYPRPRWESHKCQQALAFLGSA